MPTSVRTAHAPAAIESTAAPTTRRTTARSPLPSGRALVGALLVTAAAVGVYAAQRPGGPATAYVVAAGPLDAGTRLRPELVRAVALDLPPEQAAAGFTSTAGVDGALVLAPVGAGELVQRSAVLLPTEGVPPDAPPRHELSFSVLADRAVALDLVRGDVVDVVATYGTGDAAYSRVVARHLTVLAVSDGDGQLPGESRATFTVAVDDAGRALELAHATQVGAVTLVRATGTGGGDGAPDTYRPAPPTTGGGRG